MEEVALIMSRSKSGRWYTGCQESISMGEGGVIYPTGIIVFNGPIRLYRLLATPNPTGMYSAY